MKKLICLIVQLTLVFTFSSCSKESDDSIEPCLDKKTTNSSVNAGDWKSIKLLTFIKKDLLKLKFPSMHSVVNHDIYVYKLSYNSFDDNQGNDVIPASGLLIVPKGACTNGANNPWIVLNHGTIVDNASAPTNKYSEGLFEGSAGFITLVPDYIGFGDSYSSDPNTRLHPYIISKTYASDGYSMMQAAKSALTDNSVSLGNLYIKGYSEGGYATLALQRFIQTDADANAEFFASLKATAPSAGPYSTVGLGLVLTGENADSPISPTLFGYLATSYYYNYPDISSSYEFSTIFNKTGSFDAANLFNGKKSSTLTEALYADLGISTINQLMTTDLVSTLQTDTTTLYGSFLRISDADGDGVPDAGDSGAAYGAAVAALTDGYSSAINTNDLLFSSLGTYIPGVTSIFYHCTGDNTIYPSATEGAVATFKGYEIAANILSSNVHQVLGYPDSSHGECAYIFTPTICFLEIEGAIAQGGSGYADLGETSYCKN